jgi:hypothetical protein
MQFFGSLNWIWHLSSSVLLSPLDGLIGISDLFLIVLEDLWGLSSLGLLELLLWEQILHFDGWLTEGSVNWVRLDHSNSWNWVIVVWELKHNIISNRGGLGEEKKAKEMEDAIKAAKEDRPDNQPPQKPKKVEAPKVEAPPPAPTPSDLPPELAGALAQQKHKVEESDDSDSDSSDSDDE